MRRVKVRIGIKEVPVSSSTIETSKANEGGGQKKTQHLFSEKIKD